MNSIQDFVKNNQIISHLGVNYLGNYVGYKVGHFFSRNDALVRIVNGYLVGVGTGIACNIGLYLYVRHLNKKDEGLSDESVVDQDKNQEDLFENPAINEIIEYYCR